MLLAVLLLVGTQGCSRHTFLKHLGVFAIKEHYESTRLDSGIYQIGAELCMQDRNSCREAFSFSFSVAKNSTRNIVAIKERRDGPSDAVRVGFYEVTTGHQLPCWNCSFDIGTDMDRDSYFHWGYTDKYGAVSFDDRDDKDSQTLVLIAFDEFGYSPIRLGTWPSIAKRSFRPDSKALAWYVCDSLCNLHWYDINTAEFHMTPTICPDHYLEYEWVGDVPEPRLHWGATLPRNICYDSQGEPAYPYALRPGCESPSSLDPLLCRPPKPVETDRDGRIIR